jgi:small subunit ribosomal protein S6
MRNYEVAYIADPEMDEQSLASLEEKVTGWIQGVGGEAVKVDRWGRRRLAYPIKKRVDGYYTFVSARIPPRASAGLEREMRLNEQILRFMVTLQEAV